MEFLKYDLHEITYCNFTDIIKFNIEDKIMDSVCGTIFITNRECKLIGCLRIPSHNVGKLNIDCIMQCQGVVESSGSLKEDIYKIMASDSNIGIVPIVDGKGILKGGYACQDNIWYEDILKDMSFLNYLSNKQADIGYYFKKKNLRKIVFIGLNRLSLLFSNMLLSSEIYSGMNGMLSIFCNKKIMEKIKIDYLNYDVDVNFVESIADSLKKIQADIIIMTDWTLRHIGEEKNIEKNYPQIIYSHTLISSSDFRKSMNTFYFVKFRQALSEMFDGRIKIKSVCIPTEEELKIPKKIDSITNDIVFKYFEDEMAFKRNSDEFKEFTRLRKQAASNIVKRDGEICFADFKSKYINFINKSRIVLNVPDVYDNTIYLVGPCIVSGLFTSDDHTLGFYLQKILNESNMKFKVIALGMPNDADRYYFFNILKTYNLKENDIVIYIDQTNCIDSYDFETYDLFRELYDEYGDTFYYDKIVHCGKKAMKKLSEFFFKQIITGAEIRSVNKDVSLKIDKHVTAYNPQLMEYQQYLKNNICHVVQKIGAIVMNCNPFTLGHKYLVEYASRNVDRLYIFVVEEDKSFFSFPERLDLVQKGVADIKNVKVLKSGKFIISSITFSEYFEKANIKGTTIDTTTDVEIFAKYIAPVLNISVRFVGEEPLDPITKQYNECMKTILPQYDIQIEEIPRKESDDGEVISASRVRKLLEHNNWDEIQKLVPASTYEYLRTKML